MIEKLTESFNEITGERLDNTSQLKLFNMLRENKDDIF
jgi:hypothetical protein